MPTPTVRQLLFVDIVAFSKLHGPDQFDTIEKFDAFVTATPEFQQGKDGALTALPTGDGCLLTFDDIEAPIRCAVAIARAVDAMPADERIGLRMGVHSGPVFERTGLDGSRNVAGPGANMAQRVMDLGDAGHILVSEAARAMLSDHRQDWRVALTGDTGAQRVEVGILTVKHEAEVHVHNFWGADFGKAGIPEKAAAQFAKRRAEDRAAVRRIHVRDIGDGEVEVFLEGEDDAGKVYVANLPEPLTDAERGNLAWYLESYLNLPYGAYHEQAVRVEGSMKEWGLRLRDALFGDAQGAAILALAASAGLRKHELLISSDDPGFLALPWELLYDDDFLAFGFRGICRTRLEGASAEPKLPGPGEPFRILLVVCRPYGERDVEHGAVSRPMLDALRPLRPGLELDVLRPPTFEALHAALSTSAYHLVHFDGHGGAPSGDGDPTNMSFDAQALLVFEDEDGNPDPINADKLRRVVQTAGVPLWVLNACQSGMVGDNDAMASVATRLTEAGASAVVAMSHSVRKDAAAIFVAAFYAALARHATMSEAVAAGRTAMHINPWRDSISGQWELDDWVVPALYQQADSVTPIPETVGAVPLPTDANRDVLREDVYRTCPPGDFGFIGRDYDIQRIERAMYQTDRHVVTINGVGGGGKTELAKGFARWFVETGGCPGGVFFADFRDGTDFARVMASVFGYGSDHSRLSDEGQWTALVDHLRSRACLLVWDNFETVAGYGGQAAAGGEPEQLVQPASDAERVQFQSLVRELRGGPTRVLITTRKSDERWLGVTAQKVELGGLVARDRIGLASSILATVEKTLDEFRDDLEFERLLTMLAGHPRSMEVVLPLLRQRRPQDVIASLEHETGEHSGLEDASLEVAFDALSDESKTHLPLVGLFVSEVDCDSLALFVHSGDNQQETYESLVAPSPDAEGWARILQEAARCGLVRDTHGTRFALHPTLPVFLRRCLQHEIGEAAVETLNTEFMRFYAGLAAVVHEGVRRSEPAAVATAEAEEPNLRRALYLALGEREAWDAANGLTRAVLGTYEGRGRRQERIALIERALARANWRDGDAEPSRVALWRQLTGASASLAIERNDLDASERLQKAVLGTLDVEVGSTDEPNAAVVFHQLGIIAQQRLDYDAAEAWFQKAMEIKERWAAKTSGETRERLEAAAGSDYHHLGMVSEDRHDYAAAETWYRKALAVFERLNIESHAARVAHHLGIVAQERHDYGRAETWFRKCLEIEARLGLEAGVAGSYHHLGIVAQMRGDYASAEEWYRQALAIKERLGLEAGAASDYHHLGMVSEHRHDYAAAETWYRKALAVYERLNIESHAATSLHHLGLVAQRRSDYDEANRWFRRALDIKERLGMEADAASEYHHLGCIAHLQNDLDGAETWYRKALEVFERMSAPLEAATTRCNLGILYREEFGKAVTEFARGFRAVVHEFTAANTPI